VFSIKKNDYAAFLCNSRVNLID